MSTRLDICRSLLATASLLLVAGCPAPYSLNINDINEGSFFGSRDEPAAIELSTPQIYAREALINDRRVEREYLDKLLEKSTDIPFKPQLAREVELVRSLAADLKVAYDPSAGAGITRADRLADIRAENDAAQLRNERGRQGEQDQLDRAKLQRDTLQTQLEQAQIRKQISDLAAGAAAATTPAAAAPATATPTAGAPTTPAGTAPPVAAAAAQPAAAGAASAAASSPPGIALPENQAAQKLSETVEKLDTLLDNLPKEAVTTALADNADPRELFRDRQAYRSDLRAALAEATLDDAHDDAGNALFRLQFRATVMPGRIKDKWGIAKLTVEAPVLSLDDLTELYYGWLAHATYRLNVTQSARDTSGSGQSSLARRDYEALAGASGLFEVTRAYLYNGKEGSMLGDLADICQGIGLVYEKQLSDCQELLIAVPPGDAKYIEQAFAGAPQLLLPITAEIFRLPIKLTDDILYFGNIENKKLPIEKRVPTAVCNADFDSWPDRGPFSLHEILLRLASLPLGEMS